MEQADRGRRSDQDVTFAIAQVLNMLEYISDALFVVDEHWYITYINQKSAEIWGLRREALRGLTIWDVFPQAVETPPYHLCHSAMQEQRSVTFEYFSLSVNRWFAVRAYPNGPGLILHCSDITAHHPQQETLQTIFSHSDHAPRAERNLLRYYASLQDNLRDAVIVTDLAFRIQRWNRAAELIYGWRGEEVIGQRVSVLLATHYATAEENDELALQALLAQGQWQGEVVQQHKDGAALFILSSVTLLKDEQGLVSGAVAVNHNITERKRADEALREQRDFLQLVINSVPNLITVNDRNGHFHMVNEPAARIYGLTAAEMVGKTDVEVNPNPEEVTFFLQTDKATLTSGEAVFIPEQTILGRYYQTSKIPLKNPKGPPDRLLAISTDITQRKEAEAGLAQALAKEKELSELKSRFVSMASHEFRTPLTTILLQTETLLTYRYRLTDEQIEQRLGKIRTQVGHMKEIMEDMLQLARLQARRFEFNPVALDLDTLCRSVLDELQSQVDGLDRLAYRCDAALRTVNVDEKLMRQLILNLVSNALKYSAADKMVQIHLSATSEALVFQVRDAGIGIPAADVEHLFQPFHRAANVGAIAGTGLGLTIVKEAVELHGGHITVESKSGVGTTFTVSIPFNSSASGQQGLSLEASTGA